MSTLFRTFSQNVRFLLEVTSSWRLEGRLPSAVMVSQVARQFIPFTLAVAMLMATHFQLLDLSIDPKDRRVLPLLIL
jgi:hypothetical protein